MAISERLLAVLNEQQQNKRELRKQLLISDLKAFAVLVTAFSFILLAAELATPVPLFLFCTGATLFIMLKQVKKTRRKKNPVKLFNATRRTIPPRIASEFAFPFSLRSPHLTMCGCLLCHARPSRILIILPPMRSRKRHRTAANIISINHIATRFYHALCANFYSVPYSYFSATRFLSYSYSLSYSSLPPTSAGTPLEIVSTIFQTHMYKGASAPIRRLA
jgi:hypothetical protein